MICNFLVAYTCSAQTDEPLFNAAKIAANTCSCLSPLFILVIILSNGKNTKFPFLTLLRSLTKRYRLWKINRANKQKLQQQGRTSFY